MTIYEKHGENVEFQPFDIMQKRSIRNCNLQYVFIRSLDSRYSVFSWLLTQSKFLGWNWTDKNVKIKEVNLYNQSESWNGIWRGNQRETPACAFTGIFFQEQGSFLFVCLLVFSDIWGFLKTSMIFFPSFFFPSPSSSNTFIQVQQILCIHLDILIFKK